MFKVKPVHWLGVVSLTATALCFPASARPAFLSTLTQQYKLQSQSGLTCQYCHASATSGRGFNAFGSNVRSALNASGYNLPTALYNVLASNKDSDGDGYSDALEVYAKTLPGNKTSKPKQTVAALKVAFAKAGGVGQYKAK